MEACMKCELAKQRTRVVWGEGNPHASILVVLDNPGAREDAAGEPFVCGTRATLQEAAAEAGLGEAELYVTYVLKCRPRRAYDKEEARSACFAHFQLQLLRQRPRLVLALGNVAAQTLFADPEAEVKRLRGSWHEVLGLAAAVSYHPLAVRRRPTLWGVFRRDWQMVAEKWAELGSML
ncbi:uracil-DNA glycosylase [Gordoniibacillus kamchatkensis]|uniref:Uracil-DNA glycosylase n=1 Tax=Gordoniibacillus kamchatkensis TaxID=1590651 RepID=A0ABR5AKU2_9BACL|nr:uracil-DNA glycosylase [Paenibacillus sp. VKM B-2647]